MIEIQTYIRETPIRRNFVENLPYNERLKERAKKLRKEVISLKLYFGSKLEQKYFGKLTLIDKELLEIILSTSILKPLD